MIILVLFLMVVSSLMLFFQYKTKIIYVFVSYLFGFSVAFFSLMLYTSKILNYSSHSNMDFNLYLFFSSLNIGIYTIVRIYNVGIAMIMLTSILFFWVTGTKSLKSRFVLLIIPIILFLYLNDPHTYYRVLLGDFFFAFAADNYIDAFLKFNAIFNLSLLSIYLILPFIALFDYYRNTSIRLKKVFAGISAFLVFLYDALVYYVFIVYFKMFLLVNANIYFFPTVKLDLINYSFLVVMVMLVVLIIFGMCTLYKPFGMIERWLSRDVMTHSRILNKNLRNAFHIYKNIFFSIERLARQGRDFIETDKEITVNNLIAIEKTSNESVALIGRLCDMMANFKPVIDRIEIVECIENAIQKAAVPKEIRIIKNYIVKTAYVISDTFHLTECYVNILSNAVDSIITKNAGNGCITITVISETDYVCTIIEDNGCGINKKNLNKIFKMMFSTKSPLTNWGVGLNYVKKIIKSSNGYIFVNSVFGEGARFEIVLPESKR